MAAETEVMEVKDEAEFDQKLTEIRAKKEKEGEAESRAGEVALYTIIANFTDPKQNDRLHKLDIHFWSGTGPTNLSGLPIHTYTGATQKGKLPEGVKWGFAYSNGTESTARKFVAAFDSSAGKAYAEAGPIGPIDWNVVEVKLGQAGNKSVADDPVYGGQTYVEINGLSAVAKFRN